MGERHSAQSVLFYLGDIMSTYSFTQKPAPTEPGQESNFGGLVDDANHNALTGFTANGPQTVDISASPITSPTTVSNSVVTTITVPLNATEMTVLATTNTINCSESTAAVSSNYFTIPTGIQVTIPVARVSVLYFEANTGSASMRDRKST